mgnify:CR=1 FL=1
MKNEDEAIEKLRRHTRQNSFCNVQEVKDREKIVGVNEDQFLLSLLAALEIVVAARKKTEFLLLEPRRRALLRSRRVAVRRVL